MSKLMDEALKRLAEKASTLNTRTDAANEVIEKANRELSSMNLGVELWLPKQVLGMQEVYLEGGGSFVGAIELGFAKVDGSWQLGTRLWVSELEDWYGHKPLANQDRDIRIKASAHIATLIEEITRHVDGSSKRLPAH